MDSKGDMPNSSSSQNAEAKASTPVPVSDIEAPPQQLLDPKPERVQDEVTKDKFMEGTSLCGCTKYKSPTDNKSHCAPRFVLACCCPCYSVGRLYSVLENETDFTTSRGLGFIGWAACFAYILLVALFGIGCIFPLFIAAGIATKYDIKQPGGKSWFKSYCKSLYCMPCFLVQLRNFAELQEHKAQQKHLRSQPAHQLHMV